MNEDYLMISFENTHSAIQTERLLEQHFKVATMPTLRTVTQSCGISLRLAAEDYEPARKIVAEGFRRRCMRCIWWIPTKMYWNFLNNDELPLGRLYAKM